MRYLVFLLFSFFIIIFVGCSSNVKPIKQETILLEQKKERHSEFLEEDKFLNEFEEEMAVEEKSDPFSAYNRVMTSFNDGVFEYVLGPVSRSYKVIVHKEIRVSVDNFFHNLSYPIRLVNNLLQGKVKNSGEETGRFFINSTIGILGLFDPAKSYFGLESHNEDFGQTLGFYGVSGGPHIVLPFFGPSNLRDTLSMYPDYLINPVDYDDERRYNLVSFYGESLILKAFKQVNYTSLHEGEYEKLKKDAVDLYPFLRNIYEQYRKKQIRE